MLKSLKHGAVALLGILLLFAACSDDQLGIESLPSFGLNVTQYVGGAYIAWDLVANASSYEVWRQQTSPILGGAIRLGTVSLSDATVWYDVKTVNNPLAAGVDYKYTVIAKSNADTATGTRQQVILQSSEQSRTVRFNANNLPATVALTAVENLALTVTSGNSVAANWTADANPLVSYEITYNGASVTQTSVTKNPYFFITGTQSTTVFLVKKVLTNGTTTNNYFYSPSAIAEASANIPLYAGSVIINGFTATRDDNNRVKLTLPVVPYIDLSNYEVARVRINGEYGNDWQNLTNVSSASIVSGDNDNYVLYDNLSVADASAYNYSYRLIIKNSPSEVYAIAYVDTTDAVITLSTIKALNATWQPNTVQVASSGGLDSQETSVYIKYDWETDVDYTVYRKQASWANGYALPTGVNFDWEAVTIDSKTAGTIATGSEAIKVVFDSARILYDYKIIAKGTGSKAGYIGREESLANAYSYRPSLVPTTLDIGDGIYDYNNQTVTFTTSISDTSIFTYSGTQTEWTNNTGTPDRYLYQVNFDGLSVNGYLRSGEGFQLQLRDPANNTVNVYASAFDLTRYSRNYTGQNSETPPAETDTAYWDQAGGFYFTVPYTTTRVYYDVRIIVTAK